MSCTESMVPFNSCQSKQVDSQGTGQTTGRMRPPNSPPVPAVPTPCPLPSLPAADDQEQTPPTRLPLSPQASTLAPSLGPALSLTHLEFLPFDTHPEAAPASSTGAANSPPAHAPAQLPPDALNRASLIKALRILSVSSSSLSPAPAATKINRNTNSPLRRKPNTCTHTHTNMHLHICTGAHTETYTHMLADMGMHTHAHTCMYTCVYMHTYTHTCAYTYIHTHPYTGTHAYAYTCVRAHMCIYTHVHTFVYMHAHVHTHAHGPNILHQVDCTMSPGASGPSPLKPHPPKTPISSRS